MNKSFAYLAIAAFGLLAACKKDSAPLAPTPAPTTTNLTATINGSQASTPSTATGNFTGVYDASTMKLTYTVTYQGVVATVAHIHKIPLTTPASTSGGVAFPFSPVTSPITGTFTLTADDAEALLNNRMYVNIHSGTYGNGEIRGNIIKK